jgi:hypothetical protein
MDEGVRAAWEVLHHGHPDPLVVAAAAEVVKAHADAAQLRALHRQSLAQPEVLDPTGRLIDPAPAEVATALTWSTGTARARLDLAHTLVTELPQVLDALDRGDIDLAKAREIALGTCELDPADRTRLAGLAAGYAGTRTCGQLRAWLARQVAALDPDAAGRRHRKAAAKRRVWIHPESDGMATVGAYLTAEQAQAVWESVSAAAASIEGGVDAARADMFVARLTGLDVGTPVPVTVLQTDTGPEIAGYGPITGAHHASLCDGQPTIRLTPPAPTPGYRPAPALARWIRAVHRHCRFPGCRRPATACDLDHLIPWPTGRTTPSNLAPLCRYHHRLKTHTRWTVTPLPDGRLQWTSPTGRTYITHPHDP